MILAVRKDKYFEFRKDEFKTKEEMKEEIKKWNSKGYVCYTT